MFLWKPDRPSHGQFNQVKRGPFKGGPSLETQVLLTQE